MRMILGSAVALVALLTGPAHAQPVPVADHLKCYKIKDDAAKATYTANLGGLVAEPGCTIKVPGKLLCVETAKTSVQPVPPVSGVGQPAGRFLCYKVKCPKGTIPAVNWRDQFGARSLTPKTAGYLCAPEIPTGPTTTSTSTTGTTTTGTTTTRTTTSTTGTTTSSTTTTTASTTTATTTSTTATTTTTTESTTTTTESTTTTTESTTTTTTP